MVRLISSRERQKKLREERERKKRALEIARRKLLLKTGELKGRSIHVLKQAEFESNILSKKTKIKQESRKSYKEYLKKAKEKVKRELK